MKDIVDKKEDTMDTNNIYETANKIDNEITKAQIYTMLGGNMVTLAIATILELMKRTNYIPEKRS